MGHQVGDVPGGQFGFPFIQFHQPHQFLLKNTTYLSMALIWGCASRVTINLPTMAQGLKDNK